MADDQSTSISNQEAFDRYVKKFKSNMEAARRFMNDEGIVDEPIGIDQWVYRFCSLRSRWAKLSKRQKSESTKKAFMEFQQERFVKPDVADEPTAAKSSDEHEGDEVEETEKEQDEASTSTITPLDALSPRHSKRRTDVLFALLKEEAEMQKITTTQLLGYMLHRENYIHDRAVVSVGLKLFCKEMVSREIRLDEALFMLSTYKLGWTGYTSLRQVRKNRLNQLVAIHLRIAY